MTSTCSLMALTGLLAWSLASCGGSDSGSSPVNGGANGTQVGEAGNPPNGGSGWSTSGFGGGERKLVHVRAAQPDILNTLNLVTDEFVDIFDAEPAATGYGPKIVGGVHQSANGWLAVASEVEVINSEDKYQISILDRNGNLIKRFPFNGSAVLEGPQIDPGGEVVAMVTRTPVKVPGEYGLEWDTNITYMTVADGRYRHVHLVKALPPYSDETKPRAAIAWTAAGELLVLDDNSLKRLDKHGNLLSTQPVSGTLDRPNCGSISPDGKTLWFSQPVGARYDDAIWSIDLATLQLRRRIHDDTAFGMNCPVLSPDGRFVYFNWGRGSTDGLTYIAIHYSLGVRPVLEEDHDAQSTPYGLAVGDKKEEVSTGGGALVAY